MDHFSRVFVMFFVCLLQSCGHLLGKGLPLDSLVCCMLQSHRLCIKRLKKLPKTKKNLLSSKIAKKGECSAPLMSFNF